MTRPGTIVLLASCITSATLGSVHAFSVLLEPLQSHYLISRANASLTYSLALICLTVGVLIGPRLYGCWSAARYLSITATIAFSGCLLAAYAPAISIFWFGYGVLFGFANGLGYGYTLQLGAQANPGLEGRAMGLVTGSYALGAVVSARGFAYAVTHETLFHALAGLAIIIALSTLVSTVLLHCAAAKFHITTGTGNANSPLRARLFVLWLAYGCAVAAGLMAIGHAVSIGRWLNASTAIWTAPALLASCNMAGSLAAGWWVDRASATRLLMVLPIVSGIALLGLAAGPGTVVFLVCIGVIGASYGALISAYPAAIAKWFGTGPGAWIYGRVFTAWGIAGLLAPWLAGSLFDSAQSYQIALVVAAALGGTSAAAMIWFAKGP